MIPIDFSGERVDVLEQELDQAVESVIQCNSVLILCDLAGGTPFRTAVTRTNGRENVRVFYGINLNMLLEVCMYHNDPSAPDTDDLVHQIVDLGKGQVGTFGAP